MQQSTLVRICMPISTTDIVNKQDMLKNASHVHLPRCDPNSTSASKSASATNALLQLLDLLDLRSDDPLKDELGNPVPLLNLVIRVRVVEQQDLDLATVVGVDDARPGVDEVLGREARPRRNTAVYTHTQKPSVSTLSWKSRLRRELTRSRWDRHANIRINQSLAASGNHRLLRRVDIVPSRKGRPPRGQPRLVGQLLDLEGGDLFHCGGGGSRASVFGGRGVVGLCSLGWGGSGRRGCGRSCHCVGVGWKVLAARWWGSILEGATRRAGTRLPPTRELRRALANGR